MTTVIRSTSVLWHNAVLHFWENRAIEKWVARKSPNFNNSDILGAFFLGFGSRCSELSGIFDSFGATSTISIPPLTHPAQQSEKMIVFTLQNKTK
jgi:hypothetical protein